MPNLTITVPAEILKRASRRALEQGTSVNAILRDYPSQFAGTRSAQAEAVQRVLELSKAARSGRGKGKWTRDELHDTKVLVNCSTPTLPASARLRAPS